MPEIRNTILIIVAIIILLISLAAYLRVCQKEKRLNTWQSVITQQVETLRTKQDQITQYKAELREFLQTVQTGEARTARSQQACGHSAGEGAAEYKMQYSLYLSRIREDILSDMEEAEAPHWWKQTALDAVFQHRVKRFEESMIAVEREGFPEEGLNCPLDSVMEQIALFVNLLDNAEEACMQVPQGRERWIRISAKQKGKKLFFRMENSCHEAAGQTRGRRTWKQDAENHGIGTEIVQEIVHKQKGWCTFTQKEDRYVTELILPSAAQMHR